MEDPRPEEPIPHPDPGSRGERSDEDRMRETAKGDFRGFGELVQRHQRDAWRLAFRFLGNAGDAQDVVQEAFLKILRNAPGYRQSARFRTYLYRVVTRLCIDVSRKKKPVYLGKVPETPDSCEPEENLRRREMQGEIRRALDTLPPAQKTAILLREFEGLDYRRIAEVMETTPKGVEGLLDRGRKTLERRLAHFWKE